MKEPEQIVRKFLAALEARDLTVAQTLMSDNVEMIFPGNSRPASLTALVANSAGRYRNIGKHIEGCDVTSGNPTIVYCYGTLFGTWLNGKNFDGIRFVDRFEIDGGKIIRQWVWNDAGEARLLSAKEAS